MTARPATGLATVLNATPEMSTTSYPEPFGISAAGTRSVTVITTVCGQSSDTCAEAICGSFSTRDAAAPVSTDTSGVPVPTAEVLITCCAETVFSPTTRTLVTANSDVCHTITYATMKSTMSATVTVTESRRQRSRERIRAA